MAQSKKLFLLDAMALIYRAYYALIKNPMYNSKGLNTSAIYGFTNTLLDVLKKEEPTHIAVVFDTRAPTVRHEVYAEYKATREAMPEDIALAIPYIKQLIEAFNIPVLFVDGYEADDLIGTLAKKAEKAGFTTYMMTPDKDFGQLVSENIFIYKPARFGNEAEVMGIAEVCKKFEIEKPEQVIDILGLWGDAVDNIPGIPGVGEKTAKKLIGEFGSVENVLDNTDKLQGKLKERVEENKEQAKLSKKLATIICDAPVEFDEEQLILKGLNRESLKEIFNELEFRGLAKRVLETTRQPPLASGKTSPDTQIYGTDAQKTLSPQARPKRGDSQINLFEQVAPTHKVSEQVNTQDEPQTEDDDLFSNQYSTIDSIKHKYHLIDTAEKRTDLIKNLLKQKSICFDTETTGLDAHIAELVGISFSYKPHEAYYVPVPEKFKAAKTVVNEFKNLLENKKIEKTGQNLKYDISVLKKYDIEVNGKLFDTMLAHYLIQPDMRHNMNLLAETYLNYSPVSIETLIGKKGKNQLSIRTVPLEQLVEYACEDADITLQLKHFFKPLLKDTNTQKLFDEIEIPLIPVLSSMEFEGIRLDKNTLKELSVELEKDIQKLEKEIHKLAKRSFNIDSPKQLGEILFDVLKITDKPQKTKTGQYSTAEDVLSKLINKHDIVQKLLDFRSLRKLKSTYVDALPTMVNPVTGKIHTSFNQAIAVTGRLSSDKPNLQNIPIRTERGREVRKAFVPRNDEYILLSADYSQIELRIVAELSKDKGMSDAFIEGRDIHAATASKVYGVKIEDVSDEMRRNAKMVNFGIIYGISAFGLSQRLNIPRKEAAHIIEQYFIQFPMVREYMDKNIAFAKEHGYVETIMGRRRYLRDINSNNAIVRGYAERNAINAPVQGSAADMIKIAMINIYRELMKLKLKTKMILQVHDELVFDVFKKEKEIVMPIIEKEMKKAIPMIVPIEVDMKTGINWLEAHF